MKYVKIITISIFIFISAFYMSKVIAENIQLRNVEKELKEKEYILSDFEKKRNLELATNRIILDSIPVTYENRIQNLFNLIDTNKLILFVSDKHCEICIEAQLECILKNKNSNPDNIIILLQTFSNRNVEIFKRKNNLKYTVLGSDEGIYKFLPDLYEPYFFILNIPTKRIQSMFIPDKNDPNTTQVYLNSINSKYFNSYIS